MRGTEFICTQPLSNYQRLTYFSDSPSFSLPALSLFSFTVILLEQRCFLFLSLSNTEQSAHWIETGYMLQQRQQCSSVLTFQVVGYNIVLELYYKMLSQYLTTLSDWEPHVVGPSQWKDLVVCTPLSLMSHVVNLNDWKTPDTRQTLCRLCSVFKPLVVHNSWWPPSGSFRITSCMENWSCWEQ